MTVDNRFDPAAWEAAWKEDMHTGVNKMKRAGIDPTHAFDGKARSFNEEAFSEEGRRRARRIMNWMEDQGVTFQGASILDVGAASGGFAVPFAARGARVTAVEPSLPLAELLRVNTADMSGAVEVVTEPFEAIDIRDRGWEKAFDVVFVSMCPVIVDWESVEKVLSCARAFCYISMSVGPREHSLADAIWPQLAAKTARAVHLEMAYLLQLLLLKGYAFQSLVTREMKTSTMPREAALEDTINWLTMRNVPVDERTRSIVSDYLDRHYPSGEVELRQGGRFGKVLVRLSDQSMYSRD